MRRSQNEITNREEIIEIINRTKVVRVGMSVNDVPYIVPLNYGYENDVFYFHGAKEGRKIDMVKANPNVCFELDTDHVLVGVSERACDWTMTYASVMGSGVMTIIDDPKEKKTALNILMSNYSDVKDYDYSDKMLERIGIMKLAVTEMTGKRSK